MLNKYKIIFLITLLIVFAFNVNAAYYSMHQTYGGIYNQYKPEDYAGQSEFIYYVRMQYTNYNIPSELKIFIPPGTKYINGEMVKQYESYDIGYAERYKSAPSCAYCSYDTAPWDDFTRELAKYKLSYMENNDLYSKNIGGTAHLARFIGYGTPLSVADSGWYYIHKFGNGGIQQVEFSLVVDTATYFAWRSDPNTCWNSSGDPCDSGDTPAPPPETCDANHLDKCTTAASCASAGGYFYDDDNNGTMTCNESKPCNTPDECNSKDYGANECNLSGFYYYEDACFIDPACTSTDNCSADNCTYEASGEGFYYYDINDDGTDECNSQPEDQCDEHHPELCTDENSCDRYNHKWCNGTCYPAYQSTSCDTTAPPPSGGGGTTTGDCDAFSAMLGLCTPSSGTGDTPSTGGEDTSCTAFEIMFGGCDKTTTCDASHPSYCKDETSCEEKGHLWCNDTCYAQDDTNLPDECKLSCKENEIHFISDYNGKILEGCLPMTFAYLPKFDNGTDFYKLKDLSGQNAMLKMYAFPLFVGDKLIDGIINNGDILDIRARLYPLGEPYDLYLALVYTQDNQSSVIFFTKNGSSWKTTTEAVPFMKGIYPNDYEEYKYGDTFDFCSLLKSAGELKGDFNIWYLAFPASEKYTDNLKGLAARYAEQEKHSIEYYILKNKCDFEALNNNTIPDNNTPDGCAVKTPNDQDCDGDGYFLHLDNDCNDNDPNIHPGAIDPSGDGVDQNCNGRDG